MKMTLPPMARWLPPRNGSPTARTERSRRRGSKRSGVGHRRRGSTARGCSARTTATLHRSQHRIGEHYNRHSIIDPSPPHTVNMPDYLERKRVNTVYAHACLHGPTVRKLFKKLNPPRAPVSCRQSAVSQSGSGGSRGCCKMLRCHDRYK
jgi:hypothetical protein